MLGGDLDSGPTTKAMRMSRHISRRLSFRTLARSAPLQIGLVTGFWLAGQALAQVTGLAVPGGILGLGMVLLLLATGRMSPRSMKRGADWLLAEMLLFFVPAVLAVLNHHEFLGLVGLKVLLVIVLSTAMVMVVTALTVDFCFRWRLDHAHLDHAHLAPGAR